MNEPTTYEIVIRGRASHRLLDRLSDDFTVEHTAGGNTQLTGVVRDPAHLHGVLAHLTSIAAEIVSVGPGGPDETQATRDPKPSPNERHQP